MIPNLKTLPQIAILAAACLLSSPARAQATLEADPQAIAEVSPPLSPQASTPAAAAAAPVPDSPGASNFFGRLAHFYHQDWTGTLPASPPSPRRGPESPLPSPPFPSSDWSYGGSPVIGEPDSSSSPLMTAINRAGKRTKIYGWVVPSLNFTNSAHRNSPEGNDLYSNRFELNQAIVSVERVPDTVQRDHIDFGYHVTALFGTDYRYITGKGYLSSQLLDHNRQYGFDPFLDYADVYLSHVAQGMNLRIGRFLSPPGIEAQLSPYNYTFSHSLLFSATPSTDTGILATVKFSDRWLVQLGLLAGHDVAPWVDDAQPSGTLCVSYTSTSVNDGIYTCASGINTAKYAFNNVQQYDTTWYHKFSKTVHMATEGYFMYQRDVPAVDGPIAPEADTNAAVCSHGQIRCLAPAYALVNYINKQLSPNDYISVRTDFLNDKRGQRTGFQTRLYENTISWNHWFGSTVQLRPELRFDHALDRPAYDNGTRKNQFTAASDLIFHF